METAVKGLIKECLEAHSAFVEKWDVKLSKYGIDIEVPTIRLIKISKEVVYEDEKYIVKDFGVKIVNQDLIEGISHEEIIPLPKDEIDQVFKDVEKNKERSVEEKQKVEEVKKKSWKDKLKF